MGLACKEVVSTTIDLEVHLNMFGFMWELEKKTSQGYSIKMQEWSYPTKNCFIVIP